MATFTLEDILIATKGKALHCQEELLVHGVETDSRKISEGSLFVALKGEQFDGHSFIDKAIKGGALAVVVDHEVPTNIPQIIVENTLKAYQDLARYHRQRFHIPVVAITGSSGKTTTKELIATVLGSKLNVLKTEKNYNNEIGLPMTLLSLNDSHEVCVVEMGMRGLGQIDELAKIALPDIGVVTNVGTSHIELLGSREGIAKAKAELAENLSQSGYLILNQDDNYVKGMAQKTCARVITYSVEQQGTLTGFNIRYKADGIKFNCRCFDEVMDVFLPMIGIHNVYNALAAIAVGRVLGLPSSKIIKALGNFTGIPLRQEIINFGSFVIVNDTYNANPSSMAESICALGQLEGKRKIAVLGDMLELGDYAEEEHRKIGKLLGDEGYSMVLLYGQESKFIGEEAIKNGVALVKYFDSHETIANFYLAQQKEGDSIVLKGSRGMTMEKVAQYIQKMVK